MLRVLVAALLLGVTPPSSRTTPASKPEPVVRCRVEVGLEGAPPPPRIPARLRAVVPASASGRLGFYSDGFVTVLAPRSWACTGVEAADGGLSLSVFPAHQPNPLRPGRVPPNAAGVTVFVDYTGHGPGAQLVCTLFPGTRAATLATGTAGCPAAAAREVVQQDGTGIARFEDPPGVNGVGVPSGGTNRAIGAVVYPQRFPEPDVVTVTKLTCTAPRPTIDLCAAIVGDYLARTPASGASPEQ